MTRHRHPSAGAASSVAAAAMLLAAGCATAHEPIPSVYDGKLPSLELSDNARPISEGSLYNETSASDLVSDFRARHVGDVLQVLISESAVGKSSADGKVDKSSAVELKAPVLFGYENQLKGSLGKDFDPALALQAEGSRKFDGSGATSRNGELSGVLAVRVLAVGIDGRMLIAGQKEITVNREKQKLTLAGIVRPEDVSASNAISSRQVADLTIAYGGVGDMSDAVRQGWFHRLLAKIWPL